MRGVLGAFVTIWTVTAVGWAVARWGLLGPNAETVLARVVFFVAAPALLLTTLATADLHRVFTPALGAFVASSVVVACVYCGLDRALWRRPAGETAIGTLCAAYVNAGNLGIPVAAYALGDVAYAAPVLLFQVLVSAPLAMAVLEADRDGHLRLAGLALLPLRNPITVGSAVGITLAVIGWLPPPEVMRPLELTGSAAVPLALLVLGMSLAGARPRLTGPDAAQRYTAVALKVLAQPLLAYVIGRYALGLSGTALLAAVVTSGLPTAQNIYVYASRYGRGETLARDCIALSTLAAIGTLLAIAAALS
jgi:predicted permease